MKLLIEISFVIVWVMVFFYITLYYLIIFRIKQKHKDMWESLGKPIFFPRNNERYNKGVWDDIISGNGLSLEDYLLSKMIFLLKKYRLFDSLQ
jgi:hypothetical protein